MPQIFKALATTNAWTLFVVGWVALLSGCVRGIGAYAGVTLTPPGVPSVEMALAGGFTGLTLSVVLMKLRQMLE